MSGTPGGFRRDELEPEVAALVDDDTTGERPVIVVNTKQPHDDAVNAVRTLLSRTLLGLPPALQWLTEPFRRITVDQAVAVACSVVIAGAGGAGLLPIEPSTPNAGQLPAYVTDQNTRDFSPTPRRSPEPRAVPTSRTTQAEDGEHSTPAATPPPKVTPTPRVTAKPTPSSPPSGQPDPSPSPTLSPTPAPEASPSGQPQPSSTGGIKVGATVGPVQVELKLPVDLNPVLGLLNPN